jgi:D-serine dehydratase
LAILGAGRRDFGEDSGPPALAHHVRDGVELGSPAVAGARIRDVNDQHAIVEVPRDADIRAGDVVTLSPAHRRTTFDEWRVVHVIDGDAAVTDTIRTYF